MIFRLLAVFFRVAILHEVQYRANFLTNIFEVLASLAVTLGSLQLVYYHTETLGGWTQPQLLGLVGIYFILRGWLNLMIYPSVQRLMEDVRRGTLDFMLMKPADSQLLVSVREVAVWKILDILLGLGILGAAIWQMQERIGLGQAGAFALTMLAGAAILYSLLLILATCVFWFVRLENVLVILDSFLEAGRWPVTLYPGWLRLILTFLVPVAFATTIPAQALAGTLEAYNLGLSFALACLSLGLSRWFWKFGLRYYSGASA